MEDLKVLAELAFKDSNFFIDGVLQNEVVEWCLEQNIGNIDSEEELSRLSKVIHSIIQRLITQERALVIILDSPDYRERYIELHPNFYDQE